MMNFFICLITLLLIYRPLAAATDSESEVESNLGSEVLTSLDDAFTYRFYTQLFGTIQQPANSALNFDNRFNLPRYSLGVDVRPDLFLNFEYVEAILKPRMQLRADQWEDGQTKGQSQTDVEFFIYEGSLTVNFDHQLFASYGRENLQWGPSALLSPSNPFNPNNNQNRPATEQQGIDYAKLIWVPNFNFSASFLASVDEGRFKSFSQEFHNTYALKLDYTGHNYYLSLIPSYQDQGENFRLGYVGQWNVTDAILLYSEGSVFEQNDDFSILVGGSYTFESGGTATMEYFHHENGCTLDPVSLCLTPAYEDQFVGTFIRKDYLQFQYFDLELYDSLNMILRWTYGINDNSNFAVGYLQYELGEHFQLFSIVSGSIGGSDAELSGLVDYSVTLGAGYSY